MFDLTLVDIVGLIATGLTTPSFIPQAIKIIRTKDTKAISLLMYCFLVLATGLWLIYGVFTNSPGLVIGNFITCALGALILGLKIKHG